MNSVTSWRQFEKQVRCKSSCLLCDLDRYHDAILVAGCQRSGTTILSRIITQSDGADGYQYTNDDELDAALILSGQINHDPEDNKRYCFQTTYLNDSFPEYFDHDDFRLVWVLRNPYSVIYSMIHNWKRGALNRLFNRCGARFLEGKEKDRYGLFGSCAVSRIRKACLSYNGKVSQTNELFDKLGSGRMLVVEYDEVIKHKSRLLPEIYEFLGMQYKNEYEDKLHSRSINKSDRFSGSHKEMIQQACWDLYCDMRDKYCSL